MIQKYFNFIAFLAGVFNGLLYVALDYFGDLFLKTGGYDYIQAYFKQGLLILFLANLFLVSFLLYKTNYSLVKRFLLYSIIWFFSFLLPVFVYIAVTILNGSVRYSY